MNHRIVALLCTPALAALILLAPPVAAGQSSGLVAVERAAAALGHDWALPHTAWGDPDLQGTFNNGVLTPFERPAEFAGKPFFTEAEAAAFEERVLNQRNADNRRTGDTDVALAYNNAWWDWGSKIASTRQTSLVVDPPDGRIPPYTAEAQKRIAARQQAIKERCEHTTCPPVLNGIAPADGPEDRTYSERCLLWGTAGPPMLPTAYNNNYQIIQTPQYVMIYIEMIHDVRIVPLDRRPHVDPSIRQLMGDARGHWEGNTLVVDTTNFSDDTNFRNAGRNMHLTERFTLTAPDTVLYEFTVDDPTTFTRSWSAAVPMTRTNAPIYEYACHEGNYGLAGILAGARAAEKKQDLDKGGTQ